MFSNRRNSQKPAEELYAAFKQSFPEIGPGTSSAPRGPVPGSIQGSSTLSEAVVDGPPIQRPFANTEDGKEHDETPKPFHDWRLTPSLMDPNSFAFSAFANLPPGYYTPTPGGFNTIYHSQAGDLHTPGMGMNTPLSLPHSIHGLHAQDALMHMSHFNPQMMQNPQAFQESFMHQQSSQQPQSAQHQQQQAQQQSFAPSHFLQHQDSGYVAMDDSSHKTTPLQNEAHLNSLNLDQVTQQLLPAYPTMHGMPTGEKFRFHTTLNAPTAMVKSADEIPITYLNKGQAYTMSIFDTVPNHINNKAQARYRTYVRISFEDEQQRARPGACWQLWKEGRGSNEAHQRGGKLLAVEYVDPSQGGDDGPRESPVQLESASFDGFSVFWYPNTSAGVPDVSISLRFNFLSTDFSHSKGVKGIPVRLCAKTELLSGDTVVSNNGEVCFSKVKLFRDHGAERKLSNDVAHVKKTIEKLKQQIQQAESGLGNPGKRKRSGSVAKSGSSKPGKVIKHKRTWSVDSEVDTGRLSAEEDLHMKLVTMQDMFSSTRPLSVLYLRGDPQDDPDLYPVALPGDGLDLKPIDRTTTWQSRPSISDSPTSDNDSPRDSLASISTQKARISEIQQSAIQEEDEEQDEECIEENVTSVVSSQVSKVPVKVPRVKGEVADSNLLAIDVDKNYQPPEERIVRPVACFYVRSKDASKEYYRAVYLMRRSVKDLINEISRKFEIDSHRVTRVTHINSKGLRIVVDEEVVRELPEGQDMIVEFAPMQSDHPVKHEFIPSSVIEAMVDGEMVSGDMLVSDPLEMWLNY